MRASIAVEYITDVVQSRQTKYRHRLIAADRTSIVCDVYMHDSDASTSGNASLVS